MKCPWCGSDKADCEYVDVGVGSIPCSPAICPDCEASEIDWRHFAGQDNGGWPPEYAEYYKGFVHDPPPTEEEIEKGWWRGRE